MSTSYDVWAQKHPCDFGSKDVECPVCGKMDNHASHRRGLCIWCYCAVSNSLGEAAVQNMPAEELELKARAARMTSIRRGTSPRIKSPDEERGAAVSKPTMEERLEARRIHKQEYGRAYRAKQKKALVDVVAKYECGFKSCTPAAPSVQEESQEEKAERGIRN